ncbi:hypothetical protein FIBSPDRAFT_849950 [Athelia psychrophila]|uniref:Uncharacterized protein n=1 Tax=Athelia psychrophila TaxID=1759441 RepID=A0A166C0F5_9AGAM|nr:hypothetical protein FIBSPDRAFT_869620 [Fibularhizoctonia sp. CBS 109695]KZP30937.1 hypothetical protein FIBSPDRAFT_849950 [Fibularhizoctonia sp. CBS 109695]
MLLCESIGVPNTRRCSPSRTPNPTHPNLNRVFSPAKAPGMMCPKVIARERPVA